MPSESLLKFGTAQTVVISPASLANNAGRISDVIDNSTIRAPAGMLYVQVRSGAVVPTANTPIKVYLIRRSDASPDISDHLLGTADAAVATEPLNAELIGSIIVVNTANASYYKSFPIYDLAKKFSIVLWNATGQALNATAGDHVVQFVPLTMEGQ